MQISFVFQNLRKSLSCFFVGFFSDVDHLEVFDCRQFSLAKSETTTTFTMTTIGENSTHRTLAIFWPFQLLLRISENCFYLFRKFSFHLVFIAAVEFFSDLLNGSRTAATLASSIVLGIIIKRFWRRSTYFWLTMCIVYFLILFCCYSCVLSWSILCC